jgi:UDP-3-O-[3-hydroxymyristoyl] glucosamine N-acyltransferase
VISNVPPGAKWGGFPAGPMRDWLRGEMLLRKMVRDKGAREATGKEGEEEEQE